MCGIAGILRIHAPNQPVPRPLDAIPEPWLDILDDSIKHRGPDGCGRFRQRILRQDGATLDVALIHRRLSIIDLAGGSQPMLLGTPVRAPRGSGEASPDSQPTPALLSLNNAPYTPLASPHLCPRCAPGITAVVFNGCIYNHRELRRELQAAGHTFNTDHSDTEVLLHGWRQWGPDVVDHLDGMYAAAIWDESSARILLLRDRFGEKPLYWYGPDREQAFDVAFSTSHAALLQLIATHDPESLAPARGFLGGWIKYGWSLGSASVASSINAAECLPLPRDSRNRGKDPLHGMHGWWHASLNPEANAVSPEDADQALRKAVHSRLESDVPLGCFLSGGIDSALISKYASEVRADLTAFTVRMPIESMDESAAAATTARHLAIRHEVLDCDAKPAEDLVRLIRQLGLPFGDSSLLPTTWVSRAARQAVTVALAGDGGDELFAGYDRHRMIPLLARARAKPAILKRTIASMTSPGRDPRSARSRAFRMLAAVEAGSYKELVAIFPSPLDAQLHLDGSDHGWHWGSTPVADLDSTWICALRFDRLFYLPEDLLRKTDTASMSVALEVRAPFLANDVAELAFNASPAALMPHGQRKGLLRAVARKYLPADIVDRPKMGFAIPISDWFRSDYGGMRQLLLDHLRSPDPFPGLADAGIHLNMAFINQMLREHDAAGQASLWPWKGRDHGQRLYMLLVLSIWCRWLAGIRSSKVAE